MSDLQDSMEMRLRKLIGAEVTALGVCSKCKKHFGLGFDGDGYPEGFFCVCSGPLSLLEVLAQIGWRKPARPCPVCGGESRNLGGSTSVCVASGCGFVFTSVVSSKTVI